MIITLALGKAIDELLVISHLCCVSPRRAPPSHVTGYSQQRL